MQTAAYVDELVYVGHTPYLSLIMLPLLSWKTPVKVSFNENFIKCLKEAVTWVKDSWNKITDG